MPASAPPPPGRPAMMAAFRAGAPAYGHPGPANGHRSYQPGFRAAGPAPVSTPARSPQRPLDARLRRDGRRPRSMPGRSTAPTRAPAQTRIDADAARPALGAARAQVHENYIVAQTADSLVIVDQHAAHERLVYEALKNALHSRPLPSQMLLLPEIVDLPEEDAERLALHAETLAPLRPWHRALRPGRGRGARDAVDAGRDRCRSSWCATSPTRSPTTTRSRR